MTRQMQKNNNKRAGLILCFAYPWSEDRLYGGGNLILKFYEDGSNILWINPIPNKNLTLNRAGYNKSVFLKRIFRKIQQQLKPFTQIKKNFFVISPFYIPSVENKTIQIINSIFLTFQIKFLLFFRTKENN